MIQTLILLNKVSFQLVLHFSKYFLVFLWHWLTLLEIPYHSHLTHPIFLVFRILLSCFREQDSRQLCPVLAAVEIWCYLVTNFKFNSTWFCPVINLMSELHNLLMKLRKVAKCNYSRQCCEIQTGYDLKITKPNRKNNCKQRGICYMVLFKLPLLCLLAFQLVKELTDGQLITGYQHVLQVSWLQVSKLVVSVGRTGQSNFKWCLIF